MEERLQRLRRLTSALQTRKRAYELRIAQVNNRIAMLAREREDIMSAANGLELFPGANIHYVKRLDLIGKQVSEQQNELRQLQLLHMRAGADLRRSEIITEKEAATVRKLQEARYLEQVVDTALQRRPI